MKMSTLFLRLPLRTSGSCRSSCGGGRGPDIVPRMTDELSGYYADLLDGSYDCVDRIVLNAYNTLCYSPGGFRHWWRQLRDGSDAELDNAHLMRMAGRFSRRVRGFAKANGIPVTSVTETLSPAAATFQEWQTQQFRALLAALGG